MPQPVSKTRRFWRAVVTGCSHRSNLCRNRTGYEALSVQVGAFLLGVALVVSAGACSHAEARREKTSALVATRVVVRGELVQAADGSGAFKAEQLPGDLVRDDTLTTTAGVQCLVAAQNVPAGAILSRNMFVEPSTLGMDGGYGNKGSIVKTCTP